MSTIPPLMSRILTDAIAEGYPLELPRSFGGPIALCEAVLPKIDGERLKHCPKLRDDLTELFDAVLVEEANLNILIEMYQKAKLADMGLSLANIRRTLLFDKRFTSVNYHKQKIYDKIKALNDPALSLNIERHSQQHHVVCFNVDGKKILLPLKEECLSIYRDILTLIPNCSVTCILKASDFPLSDFFKILNEAGITDLSLNTTNYENLEQAFNQLPHLRKLTLHTTQNYPNPLALQGCKELRELSFKTYLSIINISDLSDFVQKIPQLEHLTIAITEDPVQYIQIERYELSESQILQLHKLLTKTNLKLITLSSPNLSSKTLKIQRLAIGDIHNGWQAPFRELMGVENVLGTLQQAKRALLEKVKADPKQKNAAREFFQTFHEIEDDLILAGKSNVTVNAFLAMMESLPLYSALTNFKERVGLKIFEVRSDESTYASPEAMDALKEYIQFNFIKKIKQENTLELLFYADRLEIKALRDLCYRYVLKTLPFNFQQNPKLVLEIYETTKSSHLMALRLVCLSNFHLVKEDYDMKAIFDEMRDITLGWGEVDEIQFHPYRKPRRSYSRSYCLKIENDLSIKLPKISSGVYILLLEELCSLHPQGTIQLQNPSHEVLSTLFNALANDHSIKGLTISKGQWSDQALAQGQIMLRNNATLKSLRLLDVQEQLGPFFESMSTNLGLEDLYLNKTPCDDTACASLAAALAKNVSLKTLTLQSCSVRDTSFTLICQGLANNKTLTCLSAGENRLTNQAFSDLKILAQTNKILHNIELFENTNIVLDNNKFMDLINEWNLDPALPTYTLNLRSISLKFPFPLVVDINQTVEWGNFKVLVISSRCGPHANY